MAPHQLLKTLLEPRHFLSDRLLRVDSLSQVELYSLESLRNALVDRRFVQLRLCLFLGLGFKLRPDLAG